MINRFSVWTAAWLLLLVTGVPACGPRPGSPPETRLEVVGLEVPGPGYGVVETSSPSCMAFLLVKAARYMCGSSIALPSLGSLTPK